MNLGDLFISLGVKSTVGSDLDKAGGQVGGFKDTLLANSQAIGIGMAAAGAGVVALTGSSKKMNAALGVSALQLGLTKDEMRDLALETTNVTFPLAEVQQSFDLLTRAGMTSADEIAATATAFDTLGDAIGRPASEVTSALIPAFNAFGIPLEEAGTKTDTLTHLFRTTTIDMGEFSGAMNYLSADIGTLGISLEDTAAILEAMAAKGIQGSAATREFRTAVTDAEGDVDKLYEGLGLTADEVEVYRDKIEGATGMTDEFADAANEQYGVMDQLKQTWSEYSLTLGTTLEPLEGVGAGMTALGGVMMGLPAIMSLVTAAQTALGASGIIAFAPYIAAGVAIAALIAIFWWLEDEFGILTIALEWITAAGESLIAFLQGAFTIGMTVWGTMIEERANFVQTIFKGMANFIIWTINKITNAWNSLKLEIPEIEIPYVGTFGGFKLNVPQLPQIPYLAEGGIATRPTVAMVGEAGPEAIVPLSQLRGVGGIGGSTRPLVIQVMMPDGAVLCEAMVDAARLQGVNL